MSDKKIAIIGCLDTKGKEVLFMKNIIEGRGHKAVVIDTSVMGEPYLPPDFTRAQVAEAGGSDHETLVREASRELSNPVMGEGAKNILLGLLAEGKVHGVLSVGGTQGTTIAAKAMRAMPIGFPKVLVSTMASGDTSSFVDIYDITMMFSVADIMGLNKVSRLILSNAAGAVCGMVETEHEELRETSKSVGITTVGITTKCAMAAAEMLEAAGYEPVIFHTVGSGGRAMEALVRQGMLKGVLDVSLIEILHHNEKIMFDAGAGRLTGAGDMGIPQVVVPGSTAMLVFGEPDTVPEKYRGRVTIRHSAVITDVRANKEEQINVARDMAKKLNAAKGPVHVFIPRNGFDSYCKVGGKMHDRDADEAFIAEFTSLLDDGIPVSIVDLDIDQPEFAKIVAEDFIKLMDQTL